MLHMFGHSNQITVQAPEQTTIATYLESNLKHQGLDSIQFQCTQTSSYAQEPDLGHSCRTPLNLLLC